MQDFDWNILVSLYQTRSITQSARLLFLSQPALTKRLRSIEDELGCVLVLRGHTGLTFTPEGERVVKKAERILAVIQDIQEDIARSANGATGSISLGVPYSYVRFVLPSLLAEYTKLYPEVIVNITTALSDVLAQKTRSGLLDLSFVRYSYKGTDLRQELLGQDRICAVSSQPFRLEDLPDMPYIEYSKNPATVAAIRQWWEENFSVPQKLRMHVPNGDACFSMIRQGLGYSIFLDSSYFIQDSSLHTLPLSLKDGTEFTRKTLMVYRRESLGNPCVASFLEVTRKHFGI